MMQQEAFCKQILEIILDKKFTDLKFNSIQETLQNLPGYKSIRLDAYAEDAEGNLSLMVPEKKMPAGAEIC